MYYHSGSISTIYGDQQPTIPNDLLLNGSSAGAGGGKTLLFPQSDEHSSSQTFENCFPEETSDVKSKSLLQSSFRNSLLPFMSSTVNQSPQRFVSEPPFGHTMDKHNGGNVNKSTPYHEAPLWMSKEDELENLCRYARERGFIVGEQLEQVVLRSSRSCLSNSNKLILNQFKTRYGEVDSKTRSSYIQLGVRVPSKDHVSEIVGKGGAKIKLLREESGALITTPGEQDEHVFIIEAPPTIAFHTAECIQRRAEEITQNKALDRRKGHFAFPSAHPVMSRQSSVGCNGNSSLPLGCASETVNGGYTGGTVSASHRRLLTRDRIAVPQDMVGKIIGTAGSIVTTIQRDTGTEIRSPPKDTSRECAEFEISIYEQPGITLSMANERITRAKQLIAHLVMRQYEKLEQTLFTDAVNHSYSMSFDRGGMASEDALVANSLNGDQKMQKSNLPISISHWRWPDIQPLDADEAREVIDRILLESKCKLARRNSSPDLLSEPYLFSSQSNQYSNEAPPYQAPSSRTWNSVASTRHSQQNGFASTTGSNRESYRPHGFSPIAQTDFQGDQTFEKQEHCRMHSLTKGALSTANSALPDLNHMKSLALGESRMSYITAANKVNKNCELSPNPYFSPSPLISQVEEPRLGGPYFNGSMIPELSNVWQGECHQQPPNRVPSEQSIHFNWEFALSKSQFTTPIWSQMLHDDSGNGLSLAGLSLCDPSHRHFNSHPKEAQFPLPAVNHVYPPPAHDVLANSNDSGFESLPGGVLDLSTNGTMAAPLDEVVSTRMLENIWQTDVHALSANIGIIGDGRKKTPSPPFS